MKAKDKKGKPIINYKVFTSSLGKIGIATIDSKVVRVAIAVDEKDFLLKLKRRFCGFELKKGGALISKVEKEIKEYLMGKRKKFTVEVAQGGSRFARKVYSAIQKIPYGQTRSYKDVARMIKKPGASRAVGSALKSNPVAIIVPCHRVISSNGSPGGFAPGVEYKIKLLKLEGSLNEGLAH